MRSPPVSSPAGTSAADPIMSPEPKRAKVEPNHFAPVSSVALGEVMETGLIEGRTMGGHQTWRHLAFSNKALRELFSHYVTSVTLSGAQLGPSIARYRRLESVTITPPHDRLNLQHLCQCPGIRHLYLSGHHTVDDARLAQLSAHLPNLVTLQLGEGRHITDAGLEHLARLAQLTSLEIGDCPQITDAGLARIADLARLEELQLGFCERISNEGLSHLKRLQPTLQWLAIGSDRIDDAGLAHIGTLSGLICLHLLNCEDLTDEGLAHLARLSALDTLNIGPCPALSDIGLAHISRLTGLTSLTINHNMDITDEGLAHLAALRKLDFLDLFYCEDISDAGMIQLGRLTQLRSLALDATGITDAGLSHLRNLNHLEYLSLTETDTTEAGLAHLTALTNLRVLKLSNWITDQGLIHLERLPRLTELHAFECRHITPAGVERLKQANPGLNIRRLPHAPAD